jgi:hypothetical protein
MPIASRSVAAAVSGALATDKAAAAPIDPVSRARREIIFSPRRNVGFARYPPFPADLLIVDQPFEPFARQRPYMLKQGKPFVQRQSPERRAAEGAQRADPRRTGQPVQEGRMAGESPLKRVDILAGPCGLWRLDSSRSDLTPRDRLGANLEAVVSLMASVCLAKALAYSAEIGHILTG